MPTLISMDFRFHNTENILYISTKIDIIWIQEFALWMWFMLSW